MLFFLIIIFTHSWVGFLVSIGITLLVIMLMRAVFATPNGATNIYTTPMANEQPQPHEEAYYQPYQQGYQPEHVTYQEGEQQYPRPKPEYEQPQVQYPEELPPMEQ